MCDGISRVLNEFHVVMESRKNAERFFRSRDVVVEGSGLGLAIVQRVAELHGARLTLANLPEGGFQATLIFPLPGPA